MARSNWGFIMEVGAAQSRLRALGSVVHDAADDNVEDAAEVLLEDIKRRCPVDTGHLRNSYKMEVKNRGTESVALVGTDVDYAEFQEFGTRHMDAQPHVRPALEANRDEIEAALGGDIVEEAKDRV